MKGRNGLRPAKEDAGNEHPAKVWKLFAPHVYRSTENKSTRESAVKGRGGGLSVRLRCCEGRGRGSTLRLKVKGGGSGIRNWKVHQKKKKKSLSGPLRRAGEAAGSICRSRSVAGTKHRLKTVLKKRGCWCGVEAW